MNSTKKTLKCTVVDARGLAGSDKLNPYCEVVVLDTKGNQMGKAKNTKVTKGKEPRWNEMVEFSVNASTFSGMMIRCWDKHTFRRDGFLGQVTVKFNTEILESHEAIDDNFTLSKRGDKKAESVSGQLHLKIQYGELVKKPEKKDKPKEPKPIGDSSEGRKQLTASKKWEDQNIKLKNSAFVVVEEDDNLPEDSGDIEQDFDPVRKGPSAASMEKLNKDQKIALTNKNLEVHHNGSNYGFQYAKGNIKVNAGKWYYEVQLVSGQMQVGFCLDNYDPTTNTGDSWAYDSTNSQIYRKGGNPQSFGEYCYANDTIGVGLDVIGKTITYYRNGRLLGEAWKDVDMPGKNDRLVPFVALSKGSKAKFNFGKDNFTYSQERLGFHALHSKLSDAEFKELGKLFNKYKGLGLNLDSSAEDVGDVIQGDGSLKLQEDLGATEEDDPLMMIVAWKLSCEVAWEFSRSEFVEGFALYGCSTIKQMKDKCEEWRREVNNEEQFKVFYSFVFGYLKHEEKSKVLPIEEAELVWDMLLKPKHWGLYDKWLKFLKRGKHKAVTKDVWLQLLEFMHTYPKNLDNYDEMAAWPLMFDEFVEWIKDGEPDEDVEKGEEY